MDEGVELVMGITLHIGTRSVRMDDEGHEVELTDKEVEERGESLKKAVHEIAYVELVRVAAQALADEQMGPCKPVVTVFAEG